MSDVTVGEQPQQHGHWLDRLPAIDRDIAAIAEKLDGIKRSEPSASLGLAIKEMLGRPEREVLACRHAPRARFVPGRPLEIDLSLETPAASVILYYRHVNQAERFKLAAMERREHHYRVTIPATYSDSVYPLEYYFEVKSTTGKALLYPGFAKDLSNQPYFVIRPFQNSSSIP